MKNKRQKNMLLWPILYPLHYQFCINPSKHLSWWRHLQDVLNTCFVFVFRRRLNQDEFICLSHTFSEDIFKTNLFALVIHFQKTSSRRLDWDEYIRLGHTSSRHLQDVFKTSSIGVLPRHVQDVLQKRLQDNFKTFPRHIMKLNCSC